MSKQKEIGTRAETKVVKFLEEHGIHAERRALRGAKDVGDIHYWGKADEGILEVKGGRQTENINRKLRKTWLEQTVTESINAKLPGWLVIAKFGREVKDYEVWSPNGHEFYYLDEFVELLY